MNLWATAAQAAVYSIVSISVGMYYKRTIKRDREKLDRILSGVEAVFGISTTPETTIKESIVDTLQQYRKAIAAGAGVLITGILTWLASDGVLASLLEPVIPDAFKPLIGVLVGGIATVLAVIRTTNQPAPAVEAAAAAPTYRDVDTKTGHVDLIDLPSLSYQ